MATKAPYTLYYNQWSICSQMVLLTLAFRGQPKDAASEIVVQQQSIDILASKQLEETFLTEINPKGQVSFPNTKNPEHENQQKQCRFQC